LTSSIVAGESIYDGGGPAVDRKTMTTERGACRLSGVFGSWHSRNGDGLCYECHCLHGTFWQRSTSRCQKVNTTTRHSRRAGD